MGRWWSCFEAFFWWDSILRLWDMESLTPLLVILVSLSYCFNAYFYFRCKISWKGISIYLRKNSVLLEKWEFDFKIGIFHHVGLFWEVVFPFLLISAFGIVRALVCLYTLPAQQYIYLFFSRSYSTFEKWLLWRCVNQKLTNGTSLFSGGLRPYLTAHGYCNLIKW
jgi:hypothetical protein